MAKKPAPAGYPAEPRTLGEHLRKRRMDLRLLQREVGQRIGASVATVWLWEANRIAPELKWWPLTLEFLGYDPRPEPKSIGGRLVLYGEVRDWARNGSQTRSKPIHRHLSPWELGKKAPRGVYRERVEELFR